jgi:hypothetical protein
MLNSNALLGIVLAFAVFLLLAWSLRRLVRRLFIHTAEMLVVMAALLVIVTCALLGMGMSVFFESYARQFGLHLDPETSRAAGLFVGLFIGVLFSAISSAFFFLLVEIAENTKRAASLFEQLALRRQEPGR